MPLFTQGSVKETGQNTGAGVAVDGLIASAVAFRSGEVAILLVAKHTVKLTRL